MLPVSVVVYVLVASLITLLHHLHASPLPVAAWMNVSFAVPAIVALYCILLCFSLVKVGMPLAGFFAYRRLSLTQYTAWFITLVAVLFLGRIAHIHLHLPLASEWEILLANQHLATPVFFGLVLFVMPILEEFLFRGILFDGLAATVLGCGGAIVVPAYLWALPASAYNAHLFLLNLGLGLVLGIARWQTKNLWVPIFMHVHYR